jgi:hypothetical protein
MPACRLDPAVYVESSGLEVRRFTNIQPSTRAPNIQRSFVGRCEFRVGGSTFRRAELQTPAPDETGFNRLTFLDARRLGQARTVANHAVVVLPRCRRTAAVRNTIGMPFSSGSASKAAATCRQT